MSCERVRPRTVALRCSGIVLRQNQERDLVWHAYNQSSTTPESLRMKTKCVHRRTKNWSHDLETSNAKGTQHTTNTADEASIHTQIV